MGRQPTFERMLDALGHPYRRRLLVALTEDNPQVAHERFDADHAAALGHSRVDTGDISERAVVREHLPKLEHYGYIEQNEPTGAISKGPHWEEIAPLLRILCEHEEALPADWLEVPEDEPLGRSDRPEVSWERLVALSRARNKRVIRYFIEQGTDEATLADLAEYESEHAPGPNDLSRAEIGLHHVSLPRLDELDIVDYDTESKVVRKSQNFDLPRDLERHVLISSFRS